MKVRKEVRKLTFDLKKMTEESKVIFHGTV